MRPAQLRAGIRPSGCGISRNRAGLARMASGLLADVARKRNGGRHRCQPPLSGPAPRLATPPSSRSASLAISSPQNDALRRTPEQSGDGLVGPLSGAGRTWKALNHLFLRLPKQSLSKRWTAFPVPGRVRINSWESIRSVTKLSVDFLVNPSVLFWLVLQLPLMSRRSFVSVIR